MPVDPYHQKLRRERIKAAGGSHTKDDIAAIRADQADRCNYCSVPLHGRGDVDHIVSLAKGGDNSKANVQLLCRTCNLFKGDTHPDRLFEAIGMEAGRCFSLFIRGYRPQDWLDGYRQGYLPQPNSHPLDEVRAEQLYLLDLCNSVIGAKAKRPYRLPRIPGIGGPRLIVPAYFPDQHLAVDFDPDPPRADNSRRFELATIGVTFALLDRRDHTLNLAGQLVRRPEADREVIRRCLDKALRAGRPKA